MHIFPLILLLLITRKMTDTTPIDSLKIFIKGLNGKCPSDVESLHSLKFQNCPDYEKLNHIDKLTRETEKAVLCVLFYDSLLSFCEEVNKLQVTFDKLDIQLAYNYTLEKVCEKLFPDGRMLNNDLSKIILPDKCLKLCSTYDESEPAVECRLAHYFASFDVSSLSSSVKSNQKLLNTSTLPVAELIAENGSLKSPGDPNSNTGTDSHSQDTQMGANTSSGNNAAVDISEGSNLVRTKENNEQTTKSPVTVKKPEEADQSADTLPNVQIIPSNVSNHLRNNTGNTNKDKVLEQAASETPHIETPMQQKSEPTGHAEDNNETPTADQPKLEQDVPASNEGEQSPKGDDKDLEMEEQPEVKPNPGDVGQAESEFGDDSESDFQQRQEDVPDVQTTPVKDHRRLKPNTLETAVNEDNVEEELDGDSYFFSYFMVICVFFVLGYVGYHNRIKVMALVLEGKRNKRQYRGRRPNSANYHKLDSNLEEAISSTCTKNSNNVIY